MKNNHTIKTKSKAHSVVWSYRLHSMGTSLGFQPRDDPREERLWEFNAV